MFFAIQFTSDQFQSALGDVVPQVSALFEARGSRLGECIALSQLQVIAGSVESHHFVKCGRVRTTLPRDIFFTENVEEEEGA